MSKTLRIKSILDKAFKETGYQRKTHDVKYHCPSCRHVKQKLEINLETEEYQCWVCRSKFKGGGIVSLLKKISAPESCITEAKEILGDRKKKPKCEKDFSITIGEKIQEIQEQKPVEVCLPDGFYSLKNKQDTRHYWMCYNYAKSRGFSEIEMVRYNMGYVQYGDLKERLIIPSYDKDGNLNYYTARSYYDESYLKYINSGVSRDSVIGFEYFIDFSQPINLVEGGLDAVTLGFNTIPLFGKIPSKLLKLRVVQNKTPEVRIILDDDAFQDAVDMVQEFKKLGVESRIVKMEGKDPNKIGRFKTFDLIEKSKPLDFSDLIAYKIK